MLLSGLGVRMHPVPVGATGEASSKGQGGEGDHPACTNTGRKAGDPPHWGNAFIRAPRKGQRALEAMPTDQAGHGAPPQKRQRPKEVGADQQA